LFTAGHPNRLCQFRVAVGQRDANAFFFAEAYANPFAGSGDPLTSMQQLIDVGFNAVYHDPAYDLLKAIYQDKASQDDYHHEMAFLPIARDHVVEYLENHDERQQGLR
jgi:hypothetical protein